MGKFEVAEKFFFLPWTWWDGKTAQAEEAHEILLTRVSFWCGGRDEEHKSCWQTSRVNRKEKFSSPFGALFSVCLRNSACWRNDSRALREQTAKTTEKQNVFKPNTHTMARVSWPTLALAKAIRSDWAPADGWWMEKLFNRSSGRERWTQNSDIKPPLIPFQSAADRVLIPRLIDINLREIETLSSHSRLPMMPLAQLFFSFTLQPEQSGGGKSIRTLHLSRRKGKA
jgi:hypothetical protein